MPSPIQPEIPVENQEAGKRIYQCKWIENEFSQRVPILLQGENGPCALLALANVQLLRGALSLPEATSDVSEMRIMSMLAELAMSTTHHPSENGAGPSESQTIRESALQHFVELLPTLSDGMLVNVRFSSPTAFEFTKEIAALDAFPGVTLVHGWLVDPQDRELSEALGTMSYNQVLDALVRSEESQQKTQHITPDTSMNFPETSSMPIAESTPSPLEEDFGDIQISLPVHLQTPNGSREASPEIEEVDEIVAHETPAPTLSPFQVIQIREFLECYPSMLTYHGVTELNSLLREGESSILFRNSHFHVLRKHGGELFTLVTDLGFAKEGNIVWERLKDVNGDSDFVGGAFVPVMNEVNGLTPQTPDNQAQNETGSRVPNGRPGPSSGTANGGSKAKRPSFSLRSNSSQERTSRKRNNSDRSSRTKRKDESCTIM